MSTLFTSYSTVDRDIATEVYDRLTSRGYHLPFLDYHPDAGIPGGSKWEEELRWQLKVSRGLVVLCSKNWQESKWCFAELDRAKEFHKVIIPLNLDQMMLPATISSYQSIPFHERDEDAYQRLWRALETNDLHPSDDFFWPRDECPYPGLAAFHEEHAGVFFGRDQELSEFFQKYLDPMRETGECRLIYVIGPSGSGKSSFVRAGVLPRLKFKSHGAWQILTVFRWAELKRDGQRWFERLAQDIQRVYGAHPQAPPWNAEERSRRYAVDESLESFESSAHRFVMDVKDLLAALNRPATTPIIVLDQFEELLATEEGKERTRFLRFLRYCLATNDSPCRAIATVRSDFLPAIQQHPQLIPWNEKTRLFRLDLLKRERLFDVVRRPAEMVDVQFENDALVNRIVEEAQTSDALPLLAFTLKRFYDTCSDNRVLTTEAYETKLGGLDQCLNGVAQGVLADETRLNGRVDPIAENALRVGFVRELVRYEEGDDEKAGKFVRKTANWSDLPPESHTLVRKMSSAAYRLVSVDQRENSSMTVEVTHEALFRQWQTLKNWLDQRRDLLRWRTDVNRSRAAAGEQWFGLTQSQLAIARGWPAQHGRELTEHEIDWITSAGRKETRRRRVAIVVAVSFAMIAFLATAFGLYALIQRNEAQASANEAIFNTVGRVETHTEWEGRERCFELFRVPPKQALAHLSSFDDSISVRIGNELTGNRYEDLKVEFASKDKEECWLTALTCKRLSALGNLGRLHLENINFVDYPEYLKEILEALRNAPTLRKLDLGGVNGISEEHMKQIGKLTQLESLNLAGVSTEGDSQIPESYLNYLSSLEHLEELNITFMIFNGNVRSTIERFAAMPALKRITIGKEVHDTTIKAELKEKLSEMPKTREIVVE